MDTKLQAIAERSARDPAAKFDALMHLFGVGDLERCFHGLDGRKAVGADGVRKEDYGRNLEANLHGLAERIRRMGYRPGPVRERLIPKEGKPGSYRPLGISDFEDKIVQKRMAEILEAIYEPLFLKCSHGFRPDRGCHTAIRALYDVLSKEPVCTVVDIDLKSFFNTIDHEWLMKMLEHKIRDRKFLRYVRRMLKAGVLSEGKFRVTDEGTPQGSIVSPVLSNIYLHHALDEWFEKVVKKHCRGRAWLFRYADDAIACFEYDEDARRYAEALPKRMGKFGLEVQADKSSMVSFTRRKKPRESGNFDFLGFNWYMKRSRKGNTTPALKTGRKKFCAKLKRVREWIGKNKDRQRLRPLWTTFCAKLRGHINYYGVSHNFREVSRFLYRARRIVFKGLNRRSQRKSFTWEQFGQLEKQYPLPRVRIVHPLFLVGR